MHELEPLSVVALLEDVSDHCLATRLARSSNGLHLVYTKLNLAMTRTGPIPLCL
jgi:hypothetical protein